MTRWCSCTIVSIYRVKAATTPREDEVAREINPNPSRMSLTSNAKASSKSGLGPLKPVSVNSETNSTSIDVRGEYKRPYVRRTRRGRFTQTRVGSEYKRSKCGPWVPHARKRTEKLGYHTLLAFDAPGVYTVVSYMGRTLPVRTRALVTHDGFVRFRIHRKRRRIKKVNAFRTSEPLPLFI